MSLERASELALALRSTQNIIKKFELKEKIANLVVLQPIWDAIRDAGVQDLQLRLQISKPENDDASTTSNNSNSSSISEIIWNNNNHQGYHKNIDFSNISTNTTTLKRLGLNGGNVSIQDWTNLVDMSHDDNQRVKDQIVSLAEF